MTKADKLIEILDLTEARRSKWKVAVDEDTKSLKKPLKDLGFNVIDLEDGLSDDEVHDYLLKSEVDFLITQNGGDFLGRLEKTRQPKRQYHVAWVTKAMMADPKRAAQGIEAAILYDKKFQPGAVPNYIKITSNYLGDIGWLKKDAKQRQKKESRKK